MDSPDWLGQGSMRTAGVGQVGNGIANPYVYVYLSVSDAAIQFVMPSNLTDTPTVTVQTFPSLAIVSTFTAAPGQRVFVPVSFMISRIYRVRIDSGSTPWNQVAFLSSTLGTVRNTGPDGYDSFQSSFPATATAPSITFPATVGMAWKIGAVIATLVSGGTLAKLRITASDGTSTYDLGQLDVLASSGDSAKPIVATDLAIVFAPGAAVTVTTVGAVGASNQAQLSVGAYLV